MSERRVLIVDDEPALLLTYTLILERSGYQTTAAASLVEAEQSLQRNQFGLLICDLTLEGRRQGFDVISLAHAPDPAMPVILLTGDASGEVMQEAERRNVEVVFKPIEVAKLLQRVASAFDRH